VAVLIYAEAADLVDWTGQAAPDNADILLRSASLLVRQATRSAVYATDATGLPTDVDVVAAFTAATCAHAAALAGAGVDPLAAGTEAGVSSTSIGSASVTTLGYLGAEAAKLKLATTLCPEAAAILDAAGLLGCAPSLLRS
jgi:hypothetical protein